MREASTLTAIADADRPASTTAGPAAEPDWAPLSALGPSRGRLLDAIVEHFPGGIALFDHEMRMVLCNEQLKTMLDYPASLFAGHPPTMEQLFTFNAERGEYGPGNPQAQVAQKMALARERRSHVYERTRPNGQVLEVRGAPLMGGGFVTTYFDVTERRRAQDLVTHMARHDGLTNLPNRTLLLERLRAAIENRQQGMLAVHYLDLDGFKGVNDALGHGAGDALLVSVAERLSGSVRETDLVARLGGDEFAVVQPGIKRVSDAAALAGRLVVCLSRNYFVDDRVLQVGVSVGIALAPLHGSTADELLRIADAALYRSKAAGRGRFTIGSRLDLRERRDRTA